VHKLILKVGQCQNTKEKLETLASFFIIRRTSIYAAYIKYCQYDNVQHTMINCTT